MLFWDKSIPEKNFSNGFNLNNCTLGIFLTFPNNNYIIWLIVICKTQVSIEGQKFLDISTITCLSTIYNDQILVIMLIEFKVDCFLLKKNYYYNKNDFKEMKMMMITCLFGDHKNYIFFNYVDLSAFGTNLWSFDKVNSISIVVTWSTAYTLQRKGSITCDYWLCLTWDM